MWNKITWVLLLGLIAAACDSGDVRISNGSGGTNQNNSSVNIYNGYPGPDRPNNANDNVKVKGTVKANQNLNANFNSNANVSTHSINMVLPNRPNKNGSMVNGVKKIR